MSPGDKPQPPGTSPCRGRWEHRTWDTSLALREFQWLGHGREGGPHRRTPQPCPNAGTGGVQAARLKYLMPTLEVTPRIDRPPLGGPVRKLVHVRSCFQWDYGAWPGLPERRGSTFLSPGTRRRVLRNAPVGRGRTSGETDLRVLYHEPVRVLACAGSFGDAVASWVMAWRCRTRFQVRSWCRPAPHGRASPDPDECGQSVPPGP